LVAARVLDYKPSTPKAFDEVKAGIEDLLKLEAAAKLAVERASLPLKALKHHRLPIERLRTAKAHRG